MANKDINLNKSILRQNKIPILLNDPSWIKLFGNTNDKNIKNSKEELVRLISKENEITIKTHNLQKEKLESMKMILRVSDSVNNDNKKEDIVLLDEYTNKIHKINEDLEELTFELEMLPKEIRESNLKLLNDTIQYRYDEFDSREKILNHSLKEIEVLRIKLKELIKTKHDYEEWINDTYTFLHNVLGSEIIGKIDKARLK